MNTPTSIPRVIGSMWIGIVLLLVLLVAMAFATVFESTHGTDRAMDAFYGSWWFKTILYLLIANVSVAVIGRWPYSRRQIGFLMTHVSILFIFIGALVTGYAGVDGRVGIAEKQTVRDFVLAGRPTLAVLDRRSNDKAERDLRSRFGGFDALDPTDGPAVVLGDLRVRIARYVPDSDWTQAVVDDNPRPRLGIEVSLSHAEHLHPNWILAGESARLGSVTTAFRTVTSREALARLTQEADLDNPLTKGTVRVEYKSQEFEFPVEDAIDQAVPLGDTGLSVRVLRYLERASVGSGGQMANVSSERNPYIEAEITGPQGSETHKAFSRFPDFRSMHGETQTPDLKLTFIAPPGGMPSVPLEIIAGPGGELFARFGVGGRLAISEPLELGKPIPTPWPDQVLTVLRRFENARRSRGITPVEPVRKDKRVPAVLLELETEEGTEEMWVQKNRPHPVTVDAVPHEIMFGDKIVPLGFELTLDRFRVGHYPGTNRPRTFESSVTFSRSDGATDSRLVSMNNPAGFGGFTFYQSSYDQRGELSISYLSVSRDPGQPIVFAGYIMMLAGMIWVFVLRMKDRLRSAAHGAGRASDNGRGGRRTTQVRADNRDHRRAASRPPDSAEAEPVSIGKASEYRVQH